MKDLLSATLLVAVTAIAVWSVYRSYEERMPCAQPVAFAVGAIDPKFEVATATVEAEARTAVGIWNKAAGKTVLAYDQKAPLKISLVYDEREAAARLGVDLATKDARLTSERERLAALHEALVADEAAYNKKVADTNAHGGTSGSQYSELTAEQTALNERANELNLEAEGFNKEIAAFNAGAEKYNQMAGHTFEEGHYVQDASGAHIEIYEFVGTEQLERVLAHELGHAIGLGHNADPDSIMYAENESGKLAPSAADVTDLKKLCGISG